MGKCVRALSVLAVFSVFAWGAFADFTMFNEYRPRLRGKGIIRVDGLQLDYWCKETGRGPGSFFALSDALRDVADPGDSVYVDQDVIKTVFGISIARERLEEVRSGSGTRHREKVTVGLLKKPPIPPV